MRRLFSPNATYSVNIFALAFFDVVITITTPHCVFSDSRVIEFARNAWNEQQAKFQAVCCDILSQTFKQCQALQINCDVQIIKSALNKE